MRPAARAGIGFALVLLTAAAVWAGDARRDPGAGRQESAAFRAADPSVPSLQGLVAAKSELRDVVERYSTDLRALYRRYDADYSPVRWERLREFFTTWRARLQELDYDALGTEGRIDWQLLDAHLVYEIKLLDREGKQFEEMAPLIPFAGTITGLQEARRRMEPVDPKAAGATLAALAPQVEKLRAELEARLKSSERRPAPIVAFRAVAAIDSLRRTLGDWYREYAGYDPLFTWWAADPFKKADAALFAYGKSLREKVLGFREGQDRGDEPIIGDPIGAEGLQADLAVEMIPYSAKELVAIAEREFAWCEAEMKKASQEMGFGDDWKAALEKVKTMHVEPGKQPDLIRDLAREATEFVEKRNLVTVPSLAKESWRIEMMSPERQRVTPFFTGGEVVSVSYPTDSMSFEDKLMSMRGNNIPFSRATVHHELIPGHHLQMFMNARYNSHRSAFRTPFWTEGWALYWEMLLWDLNFPRTPEERVGMLFWRMHRAARIVFSLSFHLGRMTPQQAIDFLVDRVGHERANATAEVRRSFNGTYPPLYQAAYMLGGLQFRALHEQLVGGGKMTDRQFHDAILQGGMMPVEMVRSRLLNERLPRDYRPSWRFAAR
jgi:hypothetical protein